MMHHDNKFDPYSNLDYMATFGNSFDILCLLYSMGRVLSSLSKNVRV